MFYFVEHHFESDKCIQAYYLFFVELKNHHSPERWTSYMRTLNVTYEKKMNWKEIANLLDFSNAIFMQSVEINHSVNFSRAYDSDDDEYQKKKSESQPERKRKTSFCLSKAKWIDKVIFKISSFSYRLNQTIRLHFAERQSIKSKKYHSMMFPTNDQHLPTFRLCIFCSTTK